MMVDCFLLFGFGNLWHLSFIYYLSISYVLIINIYSFLVKFQIFDKNFPHYLPWSGLQFPRPQGWFLRQRCMLAVVTVGGCLLFSQVVSLYFLRLLGNFSTIQLSALVVWFHAFIRYSFFFVWFGRIIFIWCFLMLMVLLCDFASICCWS